MSSPAPAHPEVAACVALLKWLDGAGRSARARTQKSEVLLTQNDLATRLPIVSDAARDAALDPALDQSDLQPHGWILAPRAYGDSPPTLPYITVRWNVAGPAPYLQVVVVLAVAGTSSATGLRVTAYRFETGEAGTVHDFDHVQPTLSLTAGQADLPGVRAPMSTTTPAFPLDAAGPVGLVLALVRSLYGSRMLARIFQLDTGVRRAVRPYLSQGPTRAVASASGGASGPPGVAAPLPGAVASGSGGPPGS